jgi:hypothetical protein
VLACFFSSFVFVSTMSLFYRSGKPLLPLFILAFLFHVRGVHQSRVANPARSRAGFFNRDAFAALGFAVTIGLLDLQGVFYVAIACGILFVHYVLTRQLVDLLVASSIGLIALQMYNRLLGPWLIHTLNGYWPNFGYQNVPWRELPIVPAGELLFSNTYIMLGGFLPVMVVGLVGFVLCVACGRSKRSVEERPAQSTGGVSGRALFYVALVIIANIAMFTLMVARHPAIFKMQDHRHWYYPLPWLALILFAIVVGLNAVLPAMGRGARRWLQLVLVTLVAGNLASLPHYQKLMLTGPWFGMVHPQSERLKTFLRTGIDDPHLAQNYRDLGIRMRAAHSPPAK